MATISIRPADDPITEDDAFIRRAVASASTPALMMSLIHVSGDRSLLDGEIRPRTAVLNEIQSGMTDAERAAIVDLAVKVLGEYRDRGSTLPPPPSHQTVLEMMSFMVGERVSDEYVPMMLEELALDGTDRRVDSLGSARRDARPRREARVVDRRRRHVRHPGRDPARGSGHPLHGDREERRGRRHLVREPLPRLPRRRREPVLLVLVRHAARLERVLSAARGDPRLFRELRAIASASARTSASGPRSRARSGTSPRPTGYSRCATPTAGPRRCLRMRSSRRSDSSTVHGTRTSPGSTGSRERSRTRARGPRTSRGKASASP